jgi:radical SAM protein with 4Fe4S-binding SPASM domain
MNKFFARAISGLIPFRDLRHRVRDGLIHGGSGKGDGGTGLVIQNLEMLGNRFAALEQQIRQGENRLAALERLTCQNQGFFNRNSLGDEGKILFARLMLEFRKRFPPSTIQEAEMSVFSQWGEDGIIQWIIGRIPNPVPTFVEFGVENYQESNTRFLLLNNNWRGLILDGSKENMDSIRRSSLCWRHDLTAIDAFIDRDNINDIILSAGYSGEIGILSIDIDGVDYWVLKNIKVVNPQIVICEFNAIFGGDLAVTVPYKRDFDRLKEHYSGQYWGASLKAMETLLKNKGYSLLGINSNSINAFFVRNDLSGYFSLGDSSTSWLPPRHSDTRDINGELTLIRGVRDKLRLIADMPLFDISAGVLAKASDLFELPEESPAVPKMKMERIIEKPYRLFNIELSNRCVMRCIMCPRTRAMTRSLGDMGMGTYKSIVDQYVNDNKDAGKDVVWLHHFGESLLHPHFDECVSYAADKGLKPALSINPIMLKGDVRGRLLNSRPHLLYLSLDGGDEPSFARLRGVAGKYEESKKNILNFLDDKVHAQNEVTVAVSVIHLRNYNQRQIQEMGNFWNRQDGVDMFFMKPFTNWNGDIAEIDELGELPDPVLCHFPFSSLTIAWDGTVVPCCYDYDAKYPLGNVKDASISDIWNNSRIQLLRAEFMAGDVTNKLCALCRMGGKYFNRKD